MTREESLARTMYAETYGAGTWPDDIIIRAAYILRARAELGRQDAIWVRAVAAERDRCARLAETLPLIPRNDRSYRQATPSEIAAAIRAIDPTRAPVREDRAPANAICALCQGTGYRRCACDGDTAEIARLRSDLEAAHAAQNEAESWARNLKAQHVEEVKRAEAEARKQERDRSVACCDDVDPYLSGEDTVDVIRRAIAADGPVAAPGEDRPDSERGT